MRPRGPVLFGILRPFLSFSAKQRVSDAYLRVRENPDHDDIDIIAGFFQSTFIPRGAVLVNGPYGVQASRSPASDI